MSGGYLSHTPHYKGFAIKAASDIVTSIIMRISDQYDLPVIILVSSIDLDNISPIKLILRVEVIVTRWIRNSETCQRKDAAIHHFSGFRCFCFEPFLNDGEMNVIMYLGSILYSHLNDTLFYKFSRRHSY